MSLIPSATDGNATAAALRDFLLRIMMAAVLLASAWPALADIMPPERRTTWSPGIPGGVPVRTTVCATVNASTYGNGTVDATAAIQAAVNACPVGQVVQLSAGDFLVDGPQPIFINKGIVLRGAGPSVTRLRKTSSVPNPLVLIGERWPAEAASVNLTASAPKGATSVQLASSAGFSVGQLVLIDELTDNSYVYWGIDPNVAPGGVGRGWFTRYDRPVGQMLEIASISGNTISFTTPLHIAFDVGYTAQLTRYTILYGARYAGVEDLYVRGGYDDNVTIRFAMYSWVKNVESDWSYGDSFALDSCFRCVLRDSYAHDTPNPYPGGAGYMLSLAHYTADSLVENSIFINGNKVMVMRASGGGNVIGYNYFDNGYIGNYLGWVETGMNASHMTCPHFELFEGNQAFNIDGDDTWGGAVYNTFFRNNPTGKRRSYPDLDNRRAIGLMYGHYYYSFVGNVLGTPNEDPAPYGGFVKEDFFPWTWDPIGLWRIGYTPLDWAAAPDARVVNTTHRHLNFDYASNSVDSESGYDPTLPDSLYLTAKPAFFGTNPWPWVNPTGATKLYTLPARARYDAGNPTTYTLTVAKAGTGSGTVTSLPTGINCGATCSAGFLAPTAVTLTATPAAGSTFSGWSGACSGTLPCLVTMTAAQSVTSTFALVPAPTSFTVLKAGTGTGTVTSSPAGISCGTSCGATYLSGTVVTLTAAAGTGSTFAGWSSPCSGTGSCPVTVGPTTSVTATFNALPGLDTGRLAHWKLDEGSGLTAADASGTGNTASLINGPLWTAGHSGKAVGLDGIDDYVSAPHVGVLDAYPLSVSAWFKTGTTTGISGLVNKYVAGSFNGYQVFFENGALCAWLLRDNNNSVYDGTGCTMRTSGYNDNQWHQVAFVADSSGGRLYVDALLKASQPWTGQAGPASTVQEIRLGQYPGATGGGYFSGALDDVRIYGRALAIEEVQQLYDAAPPIDTAPPVISAVAAAGIGSAVATIAWTTDEAADSQVDYGPTTSYGSSTTPNASLVLAHVQVLTGLTPGTLYHYRVKSRDAAGNPAVSADFTATTLLLPSLSISNVTVTEGNAGTTIATFNVTLSPVATGTATVGFATANGTAAAGTDYVATSGTLTFNPGNTVKTVTVLVNGDTTVEGNETFFVNLSAPSGATISDNQGQGTITNDDIDGAPPAISSVAAAGISSTGATVSWTTDEPADSQVEYGPTAAYGSATIVDPVLALSHSQSLSGLAVGALYHYRVRSRDAAGNLALSGDLTLMTGTGLIAQWKLDEAAGVTAADASGNGNIGSLFNGPAWTAGRSGQGLSLDGVDDYVSVPHAPRLDAFPLSVTAWFKTNTTAGLRAVVNKYAAGSFNGYQIFFNNGDLCAWLLRSSSNFIYDGGGCSMKASGFNDGQWHQVVFVADASGGRLYVDAVQKASQPWTGPAGAPSTTQEVRLGHYPGVTGGDSYLPGVLDDVRVYDRALSTAEIGQIYSEVPPALPASATGVIAQWSLDEGSGVTTADSSGGGHAGSLVNGPGWTDGRSGRGLAFDGVDDYVSVPHAPALDAFPLSVVAWFKTSTVAGLKGLVNKYVAGSFNGFEVFFENGDLCAWLFRNNSNYVWDGSGCTLRTSGYNDDQWHQVVFVADAVSGRLYVDGVETASQPWTGPAGASSTLQEVRLGDYPGATGGAYLPGLVDEVRIYDRALTAPEVLQLYTEMPPLP